MVNKTIYIKNIYYMLAYAFQILKHNNYASINTEDFEYIEDLMAAILSKGIAQLIKQGLHKTYIEINDQLATVRGKININQSIQNKIGQKQLLSCVYDELSENNIYNQIIKSTAISLIRSRFVKKETKNLLKKELVSLQNIDVISLNSINWNSITYQRNNKNYQLLLNICYFIIQDLLHSNEEGTYKVQEFSDESMNLLFERFILEYYKVEHRELKSVSKNQVNWNLKGENEGIQFLPNMITDITIEKKDGTILIIDTKYYSEIYQTRFDTRKFKNNNLYQIYTYVKNKDVDHTGKVSGILLYAQTSNEIVENNSFNMDGNNISIRTLDLNQNFDSIKNYLDQLIISSY